MSHQMSSGTQIRHGSKTCVQWAEKRYAKHKILCCILSYIKVAFLSSLCKEILRVCVCNIRLSTGLLKSGMCHPLPLLG